MRDLCLFSFLFLAGFVVCLPISAVLTADQSDCSLTIRSELSICAGARAAQAAT